MVSSCCSLRAMMRGNEQKRFFLRAAAAPIFWRVFTSGCLPLCIARNSSATPKPVSLRGCPPPLTQLCNLLNALCPSTAAWRIFTFCVNEKIRITMRAAGRQRLPRKLSGWRLEPAAPDIFLNIPVTGHFDSHPLSKPTRLAASLPAARRPHYQLCHLPVAANDSVSDSQGLRLCRTPRPGRPCRVRAAVLGPRGRGCQ